MKKSLLLPGMIILTTVAYVNTMEQNRPETHQMLDALIVGKENNVNWPAVFMLLDSMKGGINVHEYRTPGRMHMYTLLRIAQFSKSLLAAKTLLEKYHVDPNVSDKFGVTPLMMACINNDIPMIKLLLMYGANPYLENIQDLNSFDLADDKPKILELLNTYQE